MFIPNLIFSTLSRWFGLRRRSGNGSSNGTEPGRRIPPTVILPQQTPQGEGGLAERWLRLGVSAALAGERDEAALCFTQAVQADSGFARAWLYLGGVADDPATSLTALRAAYRLDPDNEQVRTGLVWARYKLGLITRPLEQSTSPLNKGVGTPNLGLPLSLPQEGSSRRAFQPVQVGSADYWLRLGTVAALNNSRLYARYCFSKAGTLPIDERRLEEVLTRRRAWLYFAGVCGQPETTLALLERVLAEEPDNVEALRGVRWSARQLGLDTYHWRGGWPPDNRLTTDPLLRGAIGEGVNG